MDLVASELAAYLLGRLAERVICQSSDAPIDID